MKRQHMRIKTNGLLWQKAMWGRPGDFKAGLYRPLLAPQQQNQLYRASLPILEVKGPQTKVPVVICTLTNIRTDLQVMWTLEHMHVSGRFGISTCILITVWIVLLSPLCNFMKMNMIMFVFLCVPCRVISSVVKRSKHLDIFK